MMIGGPDQAVRRLDPVFKTLAPGPGDIPRTPGREQIGGTAEQGYFPCIAGQAALGHFVKMVHNGIEYVIMAAYAEGLGIILRAAQHRQAHRTRSTQKRLPCERQSTTNTISTWETSPRCGDVAV